MLRRVIVAVFVAAAAWVSHGPADAQPLTTHPRIWVRQADLPRLRAWATPANPLYQDGILVVATQFKTRMDNGSLIAGDAGTTYGYTQYPVEWAAQVFAFMSLVENDPAVRADYANRSRALLMYIMNKAVLGPIPGDGDYRGRVFATDMRSLFYGDAFPTTVDWIYPVLTPADKATIRTVFLRWINENLKATTTGLDHPEPVWVLNDSALLSDSTRVKTSANNFYNAHMNQIGLMALALDAADDVGPPDSYGKGVRDYLDNAIGAWLYVHHHMMNTLEKGGVPPEGLAYGPTGLGRAAEFMLALYTSGNADPAVRGQQVRMDTPFFDDVLAGYIHSSSPKKVIVHPDEAYKGTVYFVADHGDTYKLYYQGMTTLLGTMGLQAMLSGNTTRLNAIRWMEMHMPAGGAARLVERARDMNYVRDCLLTFMLFDPAAPAPTDPRPSLPLSWYAPGPGKILARTSWNDTASWFTYTLPWLGIDHQFGAANMFEFYRKGEWLTKQWAGYGMIVAGSDYKNTLALENAPPSTGIDFWLSNYNHRSQWLYGPGGDPVLKARSLQTDYTYALGDATKSYNNPAAGSTDIKEATRSILWVKPDTIFVYDRAESFTGGREKRFMLMLPSAPSFAGTRSTVTTATQQLVVDTLLPAGALITGDTQIPNGNGYNESAEYEKMTYRLKVDAPGGPASARFLHVLQGADTGAPVPAAQLVSSTAGTPFQGAAAGHVVAMFPVSLAAPFAGVAYPVPAGVTVHYITGLVPNGTYTAAVAGGQMVVQPGGSLFADSGGVLRYPGGAPPPPPPTTLALTVTATAASTAVGGAVVVNVNLVPGAAPPPVDAYLVVQRPDGSYHSLRLGGSYVSGVVPIARNFVPFAYNGPVFYMPFPAGSPPGVYTLYAALTQPGTVNLLTPISSFTVAVSP
ncbi:MAG: hypothetical protein AB7O28_16185 [Vicinamibacterales bacterium]